MINKKQLANLMAAIEVVRSITDIHPEWEFTLLIKEDEAVIITEDEKRYRCHLCYEDGEVFAAFSLLQRGYYSMIELGIRRPYKN